MVDLPAFLRLLRALGQHEVQYVIVGGVAMFAQGLPRATKDIDLFVKATAENVDQLKAALFELYADECINEIDLQDLVPPDGGVIRYGPPQGDYLIDILGRLGEAWSYDDLESQIVDIEGVAMCVATPKTLFLMKRDTVRLQDRADAEALWQKFDLEDEQI